MNFGNNPVIISKKNSISEVINETCERLKDRQIQYSIRRIYEMEETLNNLEHELNEFLLSKIQSK